MITATLIALVAAAAAPQPRVILKAAAAKAPACRTTPAGDQLVQAPLFGAGSEQCPVAKVADDVIVLRELSDVLEQSHQSHGMTNPGAKKRPEMDFSPALDRLVSTRLIILEAREMNLDDTPDFKAQLEEFKASRLRTMLQDSVAKSVKPDPAEVERLYRDAAREWKITSILVEKEADAKAFAEAAKAGGSFDQLAKKLVAEKKAKGGEKSEWVSPQHALPEIRAAAATAKVGATVGPIAVQGGFVMMRVDATRVPANDKAARAQATASSVSRKRYEAIRGLYLSLAKKYAKVDEALLKQLDFEAGGEKGFEALLKDQRTLATIQGERPVTVGDLTKEVSMNFFHGLAQPIAEHRVNPRKMEAWEKAFGARLFAKEAGIRKLASRPEYRRAVEEYERALTFSTFVDRVLAPGIKLTEAEGQAYYDKHVAEFTSPEMLRLEGIAFPTAKEAQGAVEKLRSGTDYAWLRQNAPGQIAPEKRTLQLDGGVISANTVPPDLAKAISGARSGEYRLFEAAKGEVYVIRVAERIPPTAQPYVQAREEIAKKLYTQKLDASLKEYADRLRKAQRVDVLITRISL